MLEEKPRREPKPLLLDHGMVPKAYHNSSFQAVNRKRGKRKIEWLETAHTYITNIAEHVNLKKGLLLWGLPNTGKTSMGTLVLKGAIARGGRTAFIQTAQLLDDGYLGEIVNTDGLTVRDRIYEADVVLFDGLGMPVITGYRRDTLVGLVAQVIDSDKGIVLTLDCDHLDVLGQAVGDAMASKLRGSCFTLNTDEGPVWDVNSGE